MIDFLWEDIIYCHNYLGKLIVDGRSKNKDIVVELAEIYGIKKVIVFVYYLQVNEMIEHNNQPIFDTLLKMFAEGFTN